MTLFQEYRDMMRLSAADKRRINKKNWKVTNDRRIVLLDKELEQDLSEAEAAELEQLQRLAGVHRGRHDWYMWKLLSELRVLKE